MKFTPLVTEVINAAQVRLATLEQQLREIVLTWTMAPVVQPTKPCLSLSRSPLLRRLAMYVALRPRRS